jgi:hypothetical protein
MKLFDEACRKKFNKDFVKASGEERLTFLKEMEVDKDSKGDAQKFYRAVKRYSIQSFTSSKKYPYRNPKIYSCTWWQLQGLCENCQ